MAKPEMPFRRPKEEPDDDMLRAALGVASVPSSPAEPDRTVPPAATQQPAPPAPPATGKETVSVRMSARSRDIYRKVAGAVGWTPNQIMGALADSQALLLEDVFEREGVVGVLNLLMRK